MADMAAGCCYRHGSRLAARGGGDGEFAEKNGNDDGFCEGFGHLHTYRAQKQRWMVWDGDDDHILFLPS